jgi:hypothetical protein
MNCEIAHERIVTAAYGELPDEQLHELDRHMAGCPDCHHEREALNALRVLADANPMLEPTPNLIARSRLRLEEALDSLPAKRWYERVGQRAMNNFASLQHAPVAACLLLIAGMGAGTVGGYQVAQSRAAGKALAGQSSVPLATAHARQPVSAAEIAGISSIVRQPNSEMVSVTYKRVVPEQIEGSLDDADIRELLMLASQDSASATVRGDSVGLLAAECKAGHSCKPEGIREALMVALRYDKNAGFASRLWPVLSPM